MKQPLRLPKKNCGVYDMKLQIKPDFIRENSPINELFHVFGNNGKVSIVPFLLYYSGNSFEVVMLNRKMTKNK